MTGVDAASLEWAVAHVLDREIVAGPSDNLTASALPGGVSGEIAAVCSGDRPLVVKRALAQLKVRGSWQADPRRILTEGRALSLAHALAPQAAPSVVDIDESTCTLVLERAPLDWTNWRDDLLAGRFDAHVSGRVGEALGLWHRETTGRPDRTDPFTDMAAFEQLRLSPFFLTSAERHPQLGDRIRDVATTLRTTKDCLVHGDFSPKNVLAGPDRVWVVDWEAAHLGDPTFDVAHLVSHLALKSLHMPHAEAELHHLCRTFYDTYGAVQPSVLLDRPHLAETLACLLLARVDGKSPAPYLNLAALAELRTLAVAALEGRPEHVLESWLP